MGHEALTMVVLHGDGGTQVAYLLQGAVQGGHALLKDLQLGMQCFEGEHMFAPFVHIHLWGVLAPVLWTSSVAVPACCVYVKGWTGLMAACSSWLIRDFFGVKQQHQCCNRRQLSRPSCDVDNTLMAWSLHV